jgi:hypothetical protein
MEVEAYRNLNRRGIWFSFRSRETGLVCDRANLASGDRRTLRACSFRVSKAGRLRVLKEKRKNVHALIRGDVCGTAWLPNMQQRHPELKPWKVKYDPYTMESFIGVNKNGMTIKLKYAIYVTFDEDGVTAWLK